MDLTFEKWEDGRWFVVLPDYEGLRDRYIGSLQYISSLSGRCTCPYDSFKL